MAADIFAIVSLAMPDWIITDVGGKCAYAILTLYSSPGFIKRAGWNL